MSEVHAVHLPCSIEFLPMSTRYAVYVEMAFSGVPAPQVSN